MSSIEDKAKENIISKIMLEISFYEECYLKRDELELLESIYQELDPGIFRMKPMKHIVSIIEVCSMEFQETISYIATDYDREDMIIFLRELMRASEGLIEAADILKILERVGYISIIDIDKLII